MPPCCTDLHHDFDCLNYRYRCADRQFLSQPSSGNDHHSIWPSSFNHYYNTIQHDSITVQSNTPLPPSCRDNPRPWSTWRQNVGTADNTNLFLRTCSLTILNEPDVGQGESRDRKWGWGVEEWQQNCREEGTESDTVKLSTKSSTIAKRLLT